MTTTEKLQRIKARCEELLALAEKRTPGKWRHTADSDRCGCLFGAGSVITDCGPNVNNTFAFIAACAGNAEAGWKTTIAAICFLQNTDETGEGIELLNAILAAWEGLV